MNIYKRFARIWFLGLLLVAVVAGCARNGGDPGTLVSIKLTPATASIPVTGTLQYTALAIYGDGSARDVTGSATYTAGTTGVTFGAAKGLATGATANVVPVIITASYDGKSATAALTVNAAISKDLKLTPASASIPVTGNQQYTLLEIFSDGTSQLRTTDPTTTWATLNNAGNVSLTAGVATGLIATPAGTPVTITASYGGKSASASLTVNAATSKFLKLSPASASIPVTGNQQYTLLEIFSDGTSQLRTTDLATSWALANNSAGNISITPSGLTAGLATGLIATPAGTPVTITATYGGKSASASLTVNAATSKALMLTPATSSIPVTGTQQYTLLEIFSDGTSLPRTTDLATSWSMANNTGGNVSLTPSGLTAGIATGLIATPAGTPVTITATYGGKTASASLTVNSATSKFLKLTPPSASTPVTGTQQYSVLEIFSDGTSQSRTEDLATVWTTTNNSGNVSLTPSGLNAGIATGLIVTPAGVPVTITATYGGKSATANLTVTAATPKSLRLTPATTSIPVSGTQQYTLLEIFSDGTSQSRTADVATVWTTTNNSGNNVSLTPSGPTAGLATGLIVTPAGTPVTISATYGGNTATADLTVTAATSKKFEVIPQTATISINGGGQQFAAIETFSDGTTSNRTLSSTWTSVNLPPGGAVVSTIGLNTGIATGSAKGQSTITATYIAGGITQTASAILTVTAPEPGPAAPVLDLKTVAPYGIIAWDAITINAGSHIYGDVALPGGVMASVVGPGTKDGGVAPHLTASAVTNSAGVTPGEINTTDNGTLTPAQLTQLQTDLKSVYDDLMARAAPVTPLTTIANTAGKNGGTFPAAAPDLSGYVLSPGIFTTAGTYGLSNNLGPLVLDAGGNPDALFIIRSTGLGISGLTSTTGSVLLQNGAKAKNVFWVLDNLTVGSGTFFQGTVVAGHVITLNTFANVQGRMLAGALSAASGAITLSGTNVITVPE